MSIESVMLSNHFNLCRPLLLSPSVSLSIRVFSNESAFHIRWPKYWSSASTSVLPVNIQDWSPLGWTGWISLKSKGLSRVFLQRRTLLLSPVTSTTGYCFALASSLHSFWSYFSTDLKYHIEHLPTCRGHLSVSYVFTFSYCLWGSQGKNTEVVCHILSELSTMTHPSWLALHAMAYSFT